jgi:hypothetical protein
LGRSHPAVAPVSSKNAIRIRRWYVRDQGPTRVFFEDLPQASACAVRVEYRTHFHVPIDLTRFGRLDALQKPIIECLNALKPGESGRFRGRRRTLWGVLPPELQVGELAEGIARHFDVVASNHSDGAAGVRHQVRGSPSDEFDDLCVPTCIRRLVESMSLTR